MCQIAFYFTEYINTGCPVKKKKKKKKKKKDKKKEYIQYHFVANKDILGQGDNDFRGALGIEAESTL